jgi:lipopolysaccharide transport system ATP-binding protein
MKSDISIKVQKVSKRYKIGNRQPYLALRDVIVTFFKNITKKKSNSDDFWALRDVSFEVKRSEVIGIIGKNGSGKSTLLKILSRITPPTSGKAYINGRVASLLEVGTGFNPELTGRENIYLNGSILGMTKKEINARFNDIVNFSGVEKFLDTPVKRYSSGMYVRLAFSIAAHLESEILLVDEVLAVGDTEFQKKCLGKMAEVTKQKGRTILFVSHNMSAIKSLCSSAIWIDQGIASKKMPVTKAIKLYLREQNSIEKAIFPIIRPEIIIHNFKILQDNIAIDYFIGDKSIDFEVDFELPKDVTLFRVGVNIKNMYGEIVCRKLLADWSGKYETLEKGRYFFKISLAGKTLTPNNYIVELVSTFYDIKNLNVSKATAKQIKVMPPSGFDPAHLRKTTRGYFFWHSEIDFKKLD